MPGLRQNRKYGRPHAMGEASFCHAPAVVRRVKLGQKGRTECLGSRAHQKSGLNQGGSSWLKVNQGGSRHFQTFLFHAKSSLVKSTQSGSVKVGQTELVWVGTEPRLSKKQRKALAMSNLNTKMTLWPVKVCQSLSKRVGRACRQHCALTFQPNSV